MLANSSCSESRSSDSPASYRPTTSSWSLAVPRLSTVSTKPRSPAPADLVRASSSGLSVPISRPNGNRKSSHHPLSWAPSASESDSQLVG